MKIDVGPKAREVIERLAAVDLSDGRTDKARAGRALCEFFERLGLPRRPVLWATGPSDAVNLVRKHRGALAEGFLKAGRHEDWTRAGYSATARAALEAARGAARSEVWNALESNVTRFAARESGRGIEGWSRARVGDEAWYFHRSALAGSVLSAGELARAQAHGYDAAVSSEYVPATLPLVEAYEAGLWFYWATRGEFIAMPRPALRLREGLLHADGAPAAVWEGGESAYFLNGVQVPEALALTPARELDARLVPKVANAEVRRELIRKIGVERVVKELGAVCVDSQGDYELLLLDLGDGRRRPYLKMRNPSIGVFHVEGVHPDCTSVREALAWRNGTDVPPATLT